MEIISIIFIVLSIITIFYLGTIYKFKKRVPILLELTSLGFYGIVILLFLFPKVLGILEKISGLNSIINFILYLSIFILFLLVFSLFRIVDNQREEITTLTREIGYLKNEKK